MKGLNGGKRQGYAIIVLKIKEKIKVISIQTEKKV